MTTRIKYGAGNTDCTCQVVIVYENTYGENEVYDYEIEYCPKHEAAPAMYEALGVAVKMLGGECQHGYDTSKSARGCDDCAEQVEQALAQAGGKE